MSCLLQIGSFIIHWLLSRLIIIDLRSSEYFSCDDARIIISTRALYSVGYFLYDDVCRSTTSKLHILIGYFFTCVTSVGACVFLACFCTSLAYEGRRDGRLQLVCHHIQQNCENIQTTISKRSDDDRWDHRTIVALYVDRYSVTFDTPYPISFIHHHNR
jgi:hypothetical protein